MIPTVTPAKKLPASSLGLLKVDGSVKRLYSRRKSEDVEGGGKIGYEYPSIGYLFLIRFGLEAIYSPERSRD